MSPEGILGTFQGLEGGKCTLEGEEVNCVFVLSLCVSGRLIIHLRLGHRNDIFGKRDHRPKLFSIGLAKTFLET